MDAALVNVLAAKIIRFLETGDAPEGLFCPDVFLDLTMPTWRVQTTGAEDLTAAVSYTHLTLPTN